MKVKRIVIKAADFERIPSGGYKLTNVRLLGTRRLYSGIVYCVRGQGGSVFEREIIGYETDGYFVSSPKGEEVIFRICGLDCRLVCPVAD